MKRPLIELRGETTFGRLRSAGYSEAQIKEALRTGFLVQQRTGVLKVENRKREMLRENPLIGIAARAVGSAVAGKAIDNMMGDDDDDEGGLGECLSETDLVNPGSVVARVVDGAVQRLQVVKDMGRDLSVVDPDNDQRIINVPKGEVAAADAEVDGNRDEPVDAATPVESWFRRGLRNSSRKSNLLTMESIGIREGEDTYTIDDEAVDANNPYAVGESAGESDGDSGGDDDFNRKRTGILKTLRSMHRQIQRADDAMVDRLYGKMKSLMSDWGVEEDEYLNFTEGLDESIRPSELPDHLQATYNQMREKVRDGISGEDAAILYFPSISEESDATLDIVPESEISDHLTNGAIMVNECR